MRVAEAMTRDVRLATPDQSLIEAAKIMADEDCGVLPVEENDRLVGMITDRDIVVRGLAQGRDANTKVRDVMSSEVKYCYEDDDVDAVAQNMGDLQLRRLPVITRGDKRLVGIVSLGDIATTEEQDKAGEALSAISEQASQHQSTGQRPH